jgi:hypothetical protein
LRILQNLGFIRDARFNQVLRFVLEEKFVDYLTNPERDARQKTKRRTTRRSSSRFANLAHSSALPEIPQRKRRRVAEHVSKRKCEQCLTISRQWSKELGMMKFLRNSRN